MKTITFYSYKGGVGRSLALTNIATRLAEFNRKICLLDFDLEAPGLPSKLSHFVDNIDIKKGIVDYIFQFTNSGILPGKIADYAISISYQKMRDKIHLIPAGDTDSNDYWKKLASINWYELLYENNNGLAFFLDMKEKIKKEIAPDFLLIDSRTGISEMSGITTALLADEIVIVAANNKENLEGVKKVIKSVTNIDKAILGKAPKITFVLSRVPFTEKPEDKTKEQLLLKKIENEFSLLNIKEVYVIHSDRDLEEQEQIKIGYELDDPAAQISRDYLKLFEKITADDLTVDEINKFNDINKSEKLYQKAIAAQSNSQKIELISQAIVLNNNNADFYIFRGFIYDRSENKLEEALKDYEHALKLDQNRIIIYRLTGALLTKMGKYEKAEEYYKKIISLSPEEYTAYQGLGVIYGRTDKLDPAIKLYSKVIELNPGFAASYNNRANIYRIKGELDKATEDIYKALELDPANAMYYVTLAEINAGLNRKNEFYLNLEIALRTDSNAVELAMSQDKIVYEQFLHENRFQKLLEKYNVILH